MNQELDIKQISLMSRRAYEGRLLEGRMEGPIEDLDGTRREFREFLDKQYFGALHEFGQALAEGYEIKHSSPFTQGFKVYTRNGWGDVDHRFDYKDEGTNYVLWKPPLVTMEPASPGQFDTPLVDFMQLRPEHGFAGIARAFDPGYSYDPFYLSLGAAFEPVVSGKIKRLLVIAPPGVGKSRSASEILPAYWRMCHPKESRVILATHTLELAQAKAEIARKYGANVIPVQVGGSLTATVGDIGILDDPFKDLREGQDFTTRYAIWDWFTHVFCTRLTPDAPIIVIMSLMDAGWLAKTLIGGVDQWTVLRYPMIAESPVERDAHNTILHMPGGVPDPLLREEGELLLPSRFDLFKVGALKRDLGEKMWKALYQCQRLEDEEELS